jgi:hypothetical protein
MLVQRCHYHQLDRGASVCAIRDAHQPAGVWPGAVWPLRKERKVMHPTLWKHLVHDKTPVPAAGYTCGLMPKDALGSSLGPLFHTRTVCVQSVPVQSPLPASLLPANAASA